MRITDQYFWNIVFGLFFVVLVVVGTIILESEARLLYTDLTVVDYVLITLATWRLIRLFAYDAITKFFREQFMDVEEKRGKLSLVKPATGPRRTLADLINCPWCLGVWFAATVTFFYLLTPYAVFVVTFLALSSAASFLQTVSNLVGHQAEKLKRENEG